MISNTFSLCEDIFEECFDLFVFGHEQGQSVVLRRVEGLGRVDASLEQDRVDAII